MTLNGKALNISKVLTTQRQIQKYKLLPAGIITVGCAHVVTSKFLYNADFSDCL